MNFALLLVVLVALASSAFAVDDCQDQKKDVGDCTIKYHVCSHYDGGWKYQAEAKDEKSGKSEKGDWHSSSTHAAEDATSKLFTKDLTDHGYDNWDCNCDYQDIDQDPCHLRVVVCYYFKDADAVDKKKLSYRGFAFDKKNADHEGKSGDGFSDQQECGQAAVNDLFSKYSDVAARCGAGVADMAASFIDAHAVNMTLPSWSKPAPALPAGLKYRVAGVGEDDKCNGPHESCCEAPQKDPNNCPDSARTHDCDAKGACCCA